MNDSLVNPTKTVAVTKLTYEANKLNCNWVK